MIDKCLPKRPTTNPATFSNVCNFAVHEKIFGLCLARFISDDTLDQPRFNFATKANKRDHHIIRLRFAELNIPSDFHRFFSKISEKIQQKLSFASSLSECYYVRNQFLSCPFRVNHL